MDKGTVARATHRSRNRSEELMDHLRPDAGEDPRVRRVLAVADWSVDPGVVAAALAEHDRREAAVYGVLVPARLPGLDWVGDPNASRPCACEQLREIERLARERGAVVAEGRVGDPEPAPAVDDALAGWDADEIVVFEPRHRLALGRRLDLTRRLGRRTGLPVSRFELPRRRRHCPQT
jgi:hypothetical protein